MKNNDKVLESYYALVGEGHMQNLIEEFDEFIEKNDVEVDTASLDQWFEKYNRQLAKKIKKKAMIARWKIISRRIASFLGILLVLSVVLTLSVGAVRVKVLNLFSDVTEKYTEFRFDEESKVNDDLIEYKTEFMYYYPTYLPNGYYIDETQGEDTIINVIYTNGESTIMFVQMTEGVVSQLDTEDANVKEVIINNHNGYLIKKDESIILQWNNDTISFRLQGAISEEEILKIANSLEKN